MQGGQIKQKVTADYILDVYEESKRKKGQEAMDLLNAAKMLAKHLNEWLVIPNSIKIKKKKIIQF